MAFDLARLLTGRSRQELAAMRGDLETMATEARQPVTRQLGFVALIAADGTSTGPGKLGEKSVQALRDFARGDALIRDPSLRASLYPKVEPLLNGLPKSLASSASQRQGDLRSVRPDRAARAAEDPDPGRGRGDQRRPQRRPLG